MRCMVRGSVMLSRNSALTCSALIWRANLASSAAEGSLLFVQPFTVSSVIPYAAAMYCSESCDASARRFPAGTSVNSRRAQPSTAWICLV